VWRRRAADTVAAMAAIAVGVAFGLLSLRIRFDEQNLIAVANPVEHMFALASWGTPDLAQAKQLLDGGLLRRLGEGLMTALAAHSFVLHPSDRPTLILEWLAIAGAVWAWRQGDRKLPFQVAVLLLAAWVLDAVFTLRQLKHEYFAYTDPLLIIAALLTAVRFIGVLDLRRVRLIAPYVVALYVIAAHQSPVKILIGREGPETSCGWHQAYLKRVERFPFCNS